MTHPTTIPRAFAAGAPAAGGMRFYLTTHKRHWLRWTDVPLFLKSEHWDRAVKWDVAQGPYAVDSGGFTELKVMGAWPEMPDGVSDRPADVWESLLAIADAAGGDWPQRAREACVTLVTASKTNDKGSLGVRLLTDLRDHVMVGIDRLPTIAILDRLNALDDAPWADLNGKPLDSRRLSKMLAEYMTADTEPIASRNIKTAGSVLKGYYATDLHDAWGRYCPPSPESPLPPLPGTENLT